MPVVLMSMEFNCTACGRPLSVVDDYEGTQVICPQCGVELPVPVVAEKISAGPDAPRWSVRIPEGKVYGPIGRDELDRWVDEGRLDGDCMLQAEGQTIWKQAALEFPRLELRPRSSNPYASPAVQSGGASTAYVNPHRGGLLLTFGILGIVLMLMCFPLGVFLGVFSPITWWMSRKDTKAIREGRMDRRGEGLTQAGLILGIVGTVLFVLYFLAVLVYIGFIFFMFSRAPGSPFGGGPGPGWF